MLSLLIFLIVFLILATLVMLLIFAAQINKFEDKLEDVILQYEEYLAHRLSRGMLEVSAVMGKEENKEGSIRTS